MIKILKIIRKNNKINMDTINSKVNKVNIKADKSEKAINNHKEAKKTTRDPHKSNKYTDDEKYLNYFNKVNAEAKDSFYTLKKLTGKIARKLAKKNSRIKHSFYTLKNLSIDQNPFSNICKRLTKFNHLQINYFTYNNYLFNKLNIIDRKLSNLSFSKRTNTYSKIKAYFYKYYNFSTLEEISIFSYLIFKKSTFYKNTKIYDLIFKSFYKKENLSQLNISNINYYKNNNCCNHCFELGTNIVNNYEFSENNSYNKKRYKNLFFFKSNKKREKNKF